MAITNVGTPQGGATLDGGDVTLTFDGTLQEGDRVLLFGGNADNDGSGDIGPDPLDGYTQLALRQTVDENFSIGVWEKIQGVLPDSSVTGRGSGKAQEATAYSCWVFRGVDQTTPLDAAIVETDVGSTQTPDLSAVVTQTDGAVVMALVGYDHNETLWDSFPSGYVNTISAGAIDTRRIGVAGATKEVATAGTEDPGPFDTSDGQSFDFYGFTVALRPASTGVSQAIGQAVETSTAQALSAAKVEAIAQVSETDVAQAVATAKTAPIGQAAEAATAQPIASVKARAIALAVEADTAQPVSEPGEQVVAIGQAAESSLAQALATLKAQGIGQAVETDVAQALTWLKQQAIGQAIEADSAQPVSARRQYLIGQAVETDLARALDYVKSLVIGQAVETDTAIAVTAVGGLIVVHVEGRTSIEVDPYSTEIDLDPSLTSVKLDPSITHVTVDQDRTTT